MQPSRQPGSLASQSVQRELLFRGIMSAGWNTIESDAVGCLQCLSRMNTEANNWYLERLGSFHVSHWQSRRQRCTIRRANLTWCRWSTEPQVYMFRRYYRCRLHKTGLGLPGVLKLSLLIHAFQSLIRRHLPLQVSDRREEECRTSRWPIWLQLRRQRLLCGSQIATATATFDFTDLLWWPLGKPDNTKRLRNTSLTFRATQ